MLNTAEDMTGLVWLLWKEDGADDESERDVDEYSDERRSISVAWGSAALFFLCFHVSENIE